MPLGQRFDPAKAIEAILYVARRVDDPTFHKVSKICYFADKYKLAKNGGLVIADEYVAMRNGPVPSRLYDMLKAARDGKQEIRAHFDVNGYSISANRDADLDFFSADDIESLDAAIRKCGKLSFKELTQLSHDSAWNAAGQDDFMSFEEIAKATACPEVALASVLDRFSMAN